MIDPRHAVVLTLDRASGRWEDQTKKLVGYPAYTAEGRVEVVFDGREPYRYPPERVRVLRGPEREMLADDTRVQVGDEIWTRPTEILTFTDPEGDWRRIFYPKGDGEDHTSRPADEVRILPNAARAPSATEVLGYWRAVVARQPAEDPLVRPFERLGFVHPESALARYLAGAPIEPVDEPHATPIFPFRCNLSQRDAVERALTRSVSVIQGPPGTGKTETILNLLANIILVEGRTAGVVSHGNSAVDNVREKLDELGFGHVLANLGKRDKRAEFFAGQGPRNAAVDGFAAGTPPTPPRERLDDLYRRLRRLQEADRERAGLREELNAYRLERRHFDRHVDSDELPDLASLPLLRRSPERILDYLVETEVEGDGRPGLATRIRRYFRYGSLRGLDPTDTAVVLRLQQAFYDRRLAELTKRIERVEEELRRANFAELTEEHRRLSAQLLHASLGERYRGRSRPTFAENTFRKPSMKFTDDYPVVLSTCHSLAACVPDGQLFDYLIIDEASQVDPLLAGLAMASCRNLVVVGDRRQLSPISLNGIDDLVPPRPAYDCRERSILASLDELYGSELPSTLLREHYRCDPAIIGFCNKSFYDGDLIPYTTGGERSMIVAPTPPGNHMRQFRDGGRVNRRELDMIAEEALSDYCAGVAPGDIGITTPFRRQADLAADLLDGPESDTVHRFQGRQKQVVILTTVLDETRSGHIGLRFADSRQLINVAVSRAVRRFILVTNNDMMPTSRRIRDLRDYILYQNPGEEIPESKVISIFDLLYRSYSKRLDGLAARLRNESKYKSENIASTVLGEILAEPDYTHLIAASQVLLRNLLPDLSELTDHQLSYVRHRASVDFVIYNRVSNRPTLAIEVDGWQYHDNNPTQLKRDELKNEILAAHNLRLLRLSTTGTDEPNRIRQALDEADSD